jgi:hypothetical protein
MSKKPQSINKDVDELTEEEMLQEIVYITEVALVNPKLAGSQVRFYRCRLDELIKAFPEGPLKVRILEKLEAKKRFLPYLNDSGNIDYTGSGEHFY